MGLRGAPCGVLAKQSLRGFQAGRAFPQGPREPSGSGAQKQAGKARGGGVPHSQRGEAESEPRPGLPPFFQTFDTSGAGQARVGTSWAQRGTSFPGQCGGAWHLYPVTLASLRFEPGALSPQGGAAVGCCPRCQGQVLQKTYLGLSVRQDAG